MGGTHFVELGFQLTHIPLHFLYGGSVGKEKKAFEIKCNHDSTLSPSLTARGKLDGGKKIKQTLKGNPYKEHERPRC